MCSAALPDDLLLLAGQFPAFSDRFGADRAGSELQQAGVADSATEGWASAAVTEHLSVKGQAAPSADVA
jgi:hypothetical protein